MARHIEVFDTTLRDGNKLPFVVLSPDDRVVLARQLAKLGVDVIEAGFPSASQEEADCVARVCDEVEGPYVAALARALPADVEKALTVLARARRPYLHIFMGVSPEFLRHVLKIHEGEALAAVADCVRTAKSAGVRVQFSLSEAPHAPHEFLLSVFESARDAGADVINLADTNGILTPRDTSAMVQELSTLLGSGSKTVIGMHCHNDLGLATANTMAAVEAGASHVEVTIGGFGERAGNAALEEVVFLMTAFAERYGVTHGIRLVFINFSLQVALRGLQTYLPVYMAGLSVPLPRIGITFTVMLALGAIISVFVSSFSRRTGKKALILVSITASVPLCLAGFLLLPSGWGYALAVLGGISLSFSNPLLILFAQKHSSGSPAMASSLIMGISWGLAGLLMVPLGALGELVGLKGTLAVICVFPLVSAVSCLRVPRE